MNHFIILAFGRLQMEKKMIYLRVIRLIFGQNIQCHLKLFKPLLQRTREQRQPKSTLVKTIQ